MLVGCILVSGNSPGCAKHVAKMVYARMKNVSGTTALERLVGASGNDKRGKNRFSAAESGGPATICFVSGEFIKVTQTCDQVSASLGKAFDHQMVRSAAA